MKNSDRKSTNQRERKAVALVFGISDYESKSHGGLRWAERDAREFANVLRDRDLGGFDEVELVLGKKATRDSMMTWLEADFRQRAENADLAVIYFAGHGEQVMEANGDSSGIICPSNYNPKKRNATGIAMDQFLKLLSGISAATVVTILDCCHAGEGTRSFQFDRKGVRSRGKGLFSRHEALAARGHHLLASCGPDEESQEVDKLEHGLFTYHLIEGMKGKAKTDDRGRVSVSSLFDYVTEAVASDAREKFDAKQNPWRNSSAQGVAYLTVGRPEVPAKPPAAAPAADFSPAQFAELATSDIVEQFDRLSRDQIAACVARVEELHDSARRLLVIFLCMSKGGGEASKEAKERFQSTRADDVARTFDQWSATSDERALGIAVDVLAKWEKPKEAEKAASIRNLLARLARGTRGPSRDTAKRALEDLELGLRLDEIREHFSKTSFIIQRILGQGLWTAAFEAVHRHVGKRHVIRTLRRECLADSAIADEFERVVKCSYNFNHPNLAGTRDAGEIITSEGRMFFAVRDYLDGITLDQILRTGRKFDLRQIHTFVRQMIAALSEAHRHGVVHCSLKPSNIIVQSDNNVILGDPSFPPGVVPLRPSRRTYEYRYVAPETFRCEKAEDPRSDIYAFGCVLFEVLCGRPPFLGETAVDLMVQHDGEAPPALAALADGLPPKLIDVVGRMLAKSPDRRASFAELDDAFNIPQPVRVARKTEAIAPATLMRKVNREFTGLVPPVSSVHPSTTIAKTSAVPVVSKMPSDPQAPIPLDHGDSASAEGDSIARTYLGVTRISNDAAAPADRRPPAAALNNEVANDPLLRSIPTIEGRKILDQYEIVRKLGQGGMGAVFLARHSSLDLFVALKIMPPDFGDDSGIAPRFQREARLVAQLNSPNIVRVFDANYRGGLLYFAMEYVEGESLAAIIRRRGPLDESTASRIMLQAARGLRTAHARGIIHRDIKPHNLLLSKEGVLKIVDFGIARLSDDKFSTLTGTIMGTPHYMSPEQFESATAAGASSDIYSLGATMYELLTGKKLVEGGSIVEIMHKIVKMGRRPIEKELSGISPSFRKILDRCLRKNPADRFANGGELVAALEHAIRFRNEDPEAPIAISQN